jgi:hypothetical protein
LEHYRPIAEVSLLSDRHDSEPEEHEEPRQGKILPFSTRRPPDWLMGPGDEFRSVSDPREDDLAENPADGLPRPVLIRPGEPAADSDPPPEPVVLERAQPEPEPAEASRKPAGPVRWAPAASSVPIIRLPLPSDVGPAREEPAEKHEVRPVPAAPSVEEAGPAPASHALKPLDEPLWLVVLDTLRTSRLVQLTVLGAATCVTVLALWMWPRGVGTTPLSEVHHYPAQYDGRTVTVRGKVGDDVFTVGSGWAFYLMQGRDTIVTFTRSRSPKPHEVMTVKGQVSVGFLDGVPRQALFEAGTPTP